MFEISYEALKNDDLGAFTRTSRAFVSSAKRGLNVRVYKELIVVPEPWLDTIDGDAWYVTADPRQFDTVEVAYMDGNENPYLEQWQRWISTAWSKPSNQTNTKP